MSAYLDVHSKGLVAVSETLLQANYSFVPDTLDQEGVIIPFDIWMIARQELVS